ncbi:helix-turn-helix domain-containing protein [Novosphingobium sp. YJ-S2-02]|uniref:Helix-turn-helix domain-containing protein n=1 Tax=Novosphingobium aureum TaxID=2792964 RepID=A0A931HGM2_9SPHN|nr:helix-turn-helix domain-containing protein [Novosphingobium aureum]MBH0115018.1 helix-turn-helix domain-containing protein [Novosphingobium aureum]
MSDENTVPPPPPPAPNVIAMPPRVAKDDRNKSQRKFGKPVIDYGFAIVPSLLMQAQHRLGLNPVQFNIILHLIDFWWDAEKRPFPKKETLAERMNMSERQIQRHIAELENAGLVKRIGRTKRGHGKISNEYDLTGLIDRLKALEPEFTDVREENKKKRKNVGLPSHKRKA